MALLMSYINLSVRFPFHAQLFGACYRWFYKEDPKTKWVAFIGYDSLRIECRYRALEYARQRSNSLQEDDIDSLIHVKGGLYEVDINGNVMHPIYWKGVLAL